MRALTWLSLLACVAVSLAVGRPGLAIAFAGVKALLLGREFMELKHAHALHSLLFTAAVAFAVVVLAVIVGR
jgi:hypothetical protein